MIDIKRGAYKTLSIPSEFYESVEEYIKENKDLGYTSVPEFVKEAIRAHMDNNR